MKRTLCGTALFLSGAAAFAAPTVSGGTIGWPDDGWYQVQAVTEDGNVEVCQGGRSCDVPEGEYVVINLTSGVRFDGIRVGADTTGPAATAVTVDGNVIGWPDDGWYQVQDATSYASVCQGGTRCTVEPGTYRVINLTTGARFEDIRVPAAGGEGNAPTGVVVDGDTIRWPDDGWYQVQDAMTYASVCEGGTGCAVSPGSYIVINHTTGQREPVDVGSGTGPVLPEPEPPMAGENVLLLDNADALLADVVELLDDNPAMQLAPLLRRLVDPDTDLPGRSVDLTGAETASLPFRTRYACDAGGGYTMLNGNPVNGSPIYRIDETLVLDGCTIDGRTLDGTVTFRLPYFAADRFAFELQDVSLTDASGAVFTDLNGRYTDETARGPGYSARDSIITVDDLSYIRTDDGGRTRVAYLSTNSAVESFPSPRILLSGGFDIIAPWSGEGLQASFRLSGSGESAPRYEAGELTLTARSGNSLLLDADTGDTATRSLVSDVDGSTVSAIDDWTGGTTPACTSLPDGPDVLEQCTRRPVRYLVPGRQTDRPF